MGSLGALEGLPPRRPERYNRTSVTPLTSRSLNSHENYHEPNHVPSIYPGPSSPESRSRRRPSLSGPRSVRGLFCQGDAVEDPQVTYHPGGSRPFVTQPFPEGIMAYHVTSRGSLKAVLGPEAVSSAASRPSTRQPCAADATHCTASRRASNAD